MRIPPQEILGRKVLSFEDLADESGWLGPIKSGTDASSRNVLVLTLENDVRLIIRPSGTEPKNKIYVEVPGVTPRGISLRMSSMLSGSAVMPKLVNWGVPLSASCSRVWA